MSWRDRMWERLVEACSWVVVPLVIVGLVVLVAVETLKQRRKVRA